MIKLKDLLNEQTLTEVSSKDIDELKVIVKELQNASKMNKGQSERIDKIVKSISKTEIDEETITEAVDFRVKVEDRKGKLIQGGNFTLKSDANLYIKDMLKKHKLKREKGFWGNRKTGVELSTNF